MGEGLQRSLGSLKMSGVRGPWSRTGAVSLCVLAARPVRLASRSSSKRLCFLLGALVTASLWAAAPGGCWGGEIGGT